MDKLRVLTVIGTRPEIIRLSRIMDILDKKCDHTIVHTGQNYDYELNKIFFEDLSIRSPDCFLNAAGATASETIGNILIAFDKYLSDKKFDAVLVLGDTNSALSALVAKKRKIPIFHLEAGNRCFDLRVPEEINRKIIDHISDINLPYSSIAREYLLREGLNPEFIIKIGSPMYEVLDYYSKKINNSKILSNLKIKKGKFFLISSHREENIDSAENFKKLIQIIVQLPKIYNLPVIVSAHPRTKKKLGLYEKKFDKKIRVIKPLSFSDYNKLQLSAKLTLSDSGTINEESSILNFPALNLRESFERPEAMEEGAVMLVGLELNRIIQGINILEKQNQFKKRVLNIVKDYDVKNVSIKVLRILHSYVDYVNKRSWKIN